MFVCKICNLSCIRGSGHIKAKHNLKTIDYLRQYEQLDVIELYLQGFSAQQIADKIKNKNIGISPIKKDILVYLRNNNIEIRNTSEATKCWIDKTGGVWNKGLTKEQHPSIMKYAQNRTGEKNPYYTMSQESKDKTKWWERKTDAEIKQIRQRIGDNLKQQYKEGKLIPYHVCNPKWGEETKIKRYEGYVKYLKSDNKYKFGNPSKAEKEIAHFLEEKNIKYVKQATVADNYSCDLLLPEYNVVIEYYGTYWHCDPRKYKEDYYNQKKNKKAKDIWNYDKIREDKIIENKYKLIIIWEDDYKMLDNKQKKELIYEAIESSIDKKTS